ncbi:MAG: hypothetical protein AB7G37_21640 [Solirubrobacteraceae bacterium]
MLLLRFTALLLFMVVVAVVSAVADQAWVTALALLVLIVATLLLVRTIFRYSGASDWLGASEEVDLQRKGLVEAETGLPLQRHWHPNPGGAPATPGTVEVPAAWRGPDGAHRILLVGTDPVTPAQLRAALDDTPTDGGLAVLVVAPAMPADARAVAIGDPSEAIRHAEQVVHDTVEALRADGITANGHVGPADPAVAIAEGLRTYAAERVVVARHRDRGRRSEHVPVDDAAGEYGVPLREVALA